MALSAAPGLSAYSINAAVKKLDLSEELAEIIRTDNTALLQRVGAAGLVANQLKHSWVESALNPNTATSTNDAAGTLDSSETTMTVNLADRHDKRFRSGTLFKDNTAGKSEVMRVIDKATSSPWTLTIERGVGSTSGEAHAAAFPIMIITHTKQEGWKPAEEDWSAERTGVYNYSKVWSK